MSATDLGDAGGFGHRPALDGLRAVAVAMVVAYHLGLWHAGWVGVDLFFVLSGFLITGMLLEDRSATGRLAVTRFWARRARRLIPAAVLLVLVTIVLAALWPRPINDGTRWTDVVGHLGYFTNWLSILRDGSGYWGAFESASLFRHSWSLAIEEQVYLVWPVVLWLGWRGVQGVDAIRRRVIVVCAAVGTLGVGVTLWRAFGGASIDELYSGTHTRAGAFALGGLCVAAFDRRISRRVGQTLAAVGFVGVIWASLVLDGRSISTYRGPLMLASVASAATVLGVAQSGHLVGTGIDPLGWILSRRSLQAIGRWSYGIYLFHWPFVVATQNWSSDLRRVLFVGVSSVALAAASSRWIEQPIRRRPLSMSSIRVLGAVTAALVGLGLGALPTTQRRDDFVFAPVLVGSQTANEAPTSRPDASVAGSTTSEATTQATSLASEPSRRATRLLIVGDSVGQSVAEDLAGSAMVVDGRVVALNAALIGCPVFTTVSVLKNEDVRQPTDYCPRFAQEWPRMLAEFRPDAVVMVTGPSEAWAQRYRGSSVDVRIPDGAYMSHHDTEFAEMLSLLRAADVPMILNTVPGLTGARDEDRATQQAVPLVNAMFTRWAEQHDDVELVDFARYFAPLDTAEGRAQRPDGVHPDDAYVVSIADESFLAELVRAANRP